MKSYLAVIKGLLPVLLLVCTMQACSKKKDSSGSLGKNPDKKTLNEATMKAVLDMRIALGDYLDAVGVLGREIYRFSPTENRYTTDLLGAGNLTLQNNQFYILNSWKARYNVVKQAVQVWRGAEKSSQITDAEKRGFIGVAKTIMAHELLLNLNLTYTNGIYMNLYGDNPATGPVIPYEAALDSISRFLDEAWDVLKGSAMPPLPAGFNGFHDASGFCKVNRALAARVALYQSKWTKALAALPYSFFDFDGGLYTGPQYTFTDAKGDMPNPGYMPLNENGNVRLVHPTYIAYLRPGDTRAQKFSKRPEVKSQDGLSSQYDLWVYQMPATGISLIRNEELIMIYTEAQLQMNMLDAGVGFLNKIRAKHGLPPYAGAKSKQILINQVYFERWYSLLFEGHRWIDYRRMYSVDELPKDRPGDDVWDKFPLPQS